MFVVTLVTWVMHCCVRVITFPLQTIQTILQAHLKAHLLFFKVGVHTIAEIDHKYELFIWLWESYFE